MGHEVATFSSDSEQLDKEEAGLEKKNKKCLKIEKNERKRSQVSCKRKTAYWKCKRKRKRKPRRCNTLKKKIKKDKKSSERWSGLI